jgi:diguanylate cyclase (GGDEF)-like protein
MSLRRSHHSSGASPFDLLSLWKSLGLSASTDVSPIWAAQAIRGVSGLWFFYVAAKLCVLFEILELRLLAREGVLACHALLVLSLLADVGIWRLPSLRFFRALPPHFQMWALVGLTLCTSLALGLWLALVPPVMLSMHPPPIMGLTVLGLLAMCIFGNQRVLSMAYGFGVGLYAVTQEPLGASVIMVAVMLSIAIVMLNQARYDTRRLLANQAEDRRSRRAHRLLTDYEESGRGWFWETDRRGAIIYISESLARSMNVKVESLVGKQLTDLVVMGEPGESDVDRTLGFHLSTRSAFSDIPVRATISRDERRWAISGRPVINEYDQFQGFRGSGSDLTEMKRSQAEVARLAQFDSLTGLANRIQMQRTLEQSITSGRGRVGDCALLLLDLDRFKTVNDTMGHPAGDALLREVGHRLKRVVGDRGMVGRLGGDEFKVVMPGQTDRAKIGVLADAIIASLSQPYMIEGTQVVIGASIGIALCPDDGTTVDTLVRNADLALYAAKGDGRGVHRFYCSDMLAEAEDRRQLEDDLRIAIQEGALTLVYQPVVNAKTEKISGFEALLRWNHPTRGPISPALFVPIAEDAGLINALGEWVMRTACHEAAHWPYGIRVAVNVSPIQFKNPALPGIVMNALAASGLAAHQLELEITETAFVNEGEATDQMFAQLKAIGVRLALDDFGTGYSSLGYLKKAPFDKIKIDQSFVRGAAIAGSRNAAIITSIVGLAEALGMDTTAEGVETHDELELVRSLGCSHIQGYIYGAGAQPDIVRQRLAEQGGAARANGFQSSRPPRISMLRSVVILHGDNRYIGRIRNISSGGALIEGLWNVPIDTSFSIELAEGMPVGAVTRWSVEDRMGVQFNQAIDVRVVREASPARMVG